MAAPSDVPPNHAGGLTPADFAAIRAHLCEQYRGVFTPAMIEAHLDNHVGLASAEYSVAVLAQTWKLPAGSRILDVGAGYGSFVLLARDRGYQARGVEISPFEVECARRRLRRLRPDDDAEAVYRLGDGARLPVADAGVDAVTLWNVLEHVADLEALLRECRRVVRPGGIIYAICPNYLAFRQEAHYHVFWPSLIPRSLAVRYLAIRHRNPAFFQNHIFYRTNGEVLGLARRLGLAIHELERPIPRIAPGVTWRMVLADPGPFLAFVNPFKASVLVALVRPATGS